MAKQKFPEGSVCKPCWELKYCPYGPLVEFFPLNPIGDEWQYDYWNDCYEKASEEAAAPLARTPDEIADLYHRLSVSAPENLSELHDYNPDDVGCKIWGHVCPVFFTQSGATETKQTRREGRYIPRQIMFKVVRRDNHVCQVCFKYVPDNEVQFDHIIPISKGGPTNVENLRLLCPECNRKKSNALHELLEA
jgi:hypothetical protein